MQRLAVRFALAALVALALSTSRAAAADGYTITDLGALPGQPYTSVWQQTINNHGVIVGYANSNQDDLANTTFFGDSAFLWKDGTVTPLPGLPSAIDTIPFSLNNKGQVVGRSTPAGQGSHAVLWDHGVILSLPLLPGDDRGGALQINDRGQAVGFSRNPALGVRHAALWYKGIVTQLPPLPGGGVYDEGLGINEKGEIVGWSGPASGLEHIALWDKGGVHDLGTLGGDWGEAVANNNKGEIVGVSVTASNALEPFLWKHGVLTDLGVLAGDEGGVALDINNRGQVVGTSGTSIVNGQQGNVFTSHAVLWEHGLMTNLQTKIPAGSGWTITSANGINDRGEIAAQGVYNGNLRAVLLTPVHHDDGDDDGGD
jgi:probable HAF family extracellular repeat protein